MPGRKRQVSPDTDSATQAARVANGEPTLQPLLPTSLPSGPMYRVWQAGRRGGGGGTIGGGDGQSAQIEQGRLPPQLHLTDHGCAWPAHQLSHANGGDDGYAEGAGGGYANGGGDGGSRLAKAVCPPNEGASSLPEPDPSSRGVSAGHAESTPLAPGPVVQYAVMAVAHSIAVDSPPSCDRRRPEVHIPMHEETPRGQEAHIAMHAWTVQGADPWRKGQAMAPDPSSPLPDPSSVPVVGGGGGGGNEGEGGGGNGGDGGVFIVFDE